MKKIWFDGDVGKRENAPQFVSKRLQQHSSGEKQLQAERRLDVSFISASDAAGQTGPPKCFSGSA